MTERGVGGYKNRRIGWQVQQCGCLCTRCSAATADIKAFASVHLCCVHTIQPSHTRNSHTTPYLVGCMLVGKGSARCCWLEHRPASALISGPVCAAGSMHEVGGGDQRSTDHLKFHRGTGCVFLFAHCRRLPLPPSLLLPILTVPSRSWRQWALQSQPPFSCRLLAVLTAACPASCQTCLAARGTTQTGRCGLQRLFVYVRVCLHMGVVVVCGGWQVVECKQRGMRQRGRGWSNLALIESKVTCDCNVWAVIQAHKRPFMLYTALHAGGTCECCGWCAAS